MSAITTPGPCTASPACTVSGRVLKTIWRPRSYIEEEKTGTVVVVQIINTVLDTTRYSTIGNQLPSGYQPPPTNSAGTKIATITYSRRDQLFTTTVAYPTPFLIFPDTYRVVGDYQLNTSSGPQCVTHQDKTFDILINPQPAWDWEHPEWNLGYYFNPKDPLGWGYGEHYDTDGDGEASIGVWGANAFLEANEVLPDDNPEFPHAVARTCKAGAYHLPNLFRADPDWKVVGQTSVVYEGEAEATVGADRPRMSSDLWAQTAGGNPAGIGQNSVGRQGGDGTAAIPIAAGPSGGPLQGVGTGPGDGVQRGQGTAAATATAARPDGSSPHGGTGSGGTVPVEGGKGTANTIPTARPGRSSSQSSGAGSGEAAQEGQATAATATTIRPGQGSSPGSDTTSAARGTSSGSNLIAWPLWAVMAMASVALLSFGP
ncbi:hypothetical protein B0T14DRAFT_559335 [Immersiella caudata]|uniref:Uncharacterized protein n=1 Tax=Immersiella caudata TaxID=314043 RepID=A0AA39XCR6_9PEZI|nr:hypothetical protein B0T14DRAFT_559335 [Immersiella caudata]